MIEIDEAIKWIEEHYGTEDDGTKQSQVMNMVVETLKQKQWLIDQYEHEVETLELDVQGERLSIDRTVKCTKLAVYNRVLKDLKGDGEE